MAAINFYVRGLNPGNIQPGDALEKFGSEILAQSKTVLLANPPFGAERDKESYPNVWSEYPTESETTILFVKLMLETLKPGGRCAVIVSEGFLTWEQDSARAHARRGDTGRNSVTNQCLKGFDSVSRRNKGVTEA